MQAVSAAQKLRPAEWVTDAVVKALPPASELLSLRGDKVKDVTAFVVRTIEVDRDDQFHRWVDVVADPKRLELMFGRFGLPESLS